MAVKVLLELKARPGAGDALVAIFRGVLPDTRAYDGCIGVETLRGQDDPDTVVLVESWESRAHYERYFAWRQGPGRIEKLGETLAGPPSLRYFDLADA